MRSLSLEGRPLAQSPAGRLPLPVVLFAAAAGLRLVAFLAFYAGSMLTGHHGLVDPYDSVGIDHWGWYAAEHLRHGQWVNLTLQGLEGQWDVGFTYLVALQYLLVGDHPEVPRLVDLLLASFCAPAVYLAGRATVLGETVARRAGWLAAIWPLSIYWAAYDLLKDPLTWFLIALAMLALTAAGRARFVVFSALSAVPMLLVRLYMGIGLYVLLPLSAIVRRDLKGLVAVVAVFAAAEAGLLAVGYPPVWSLAPYQTSSAPPVHQQLRSGSLSYWAAVIFGDTGGQPANAGGVAGLGHGSALFVERVLVGGLITSLGPRPAVQDVVHPTLDTGMYPGLLLWLLLIPFTLLGLWRALRTRDRTVLSLVLLAVGLWLGIAYAFGADGAFRQREMAFPPTLLFTALGLERPWPGRWPWVYGGYLAAGLALIALRETGLV